MQNYIDLNSKYFDILADKLQKHHVRPSTSKFKSATVNTLSKIVFRRK